MALGFVVSCNACNRVISKMDNLEDDSFKNITQELGKVTEGTFGEGEGQIQINNVHEMLLLAGFAFYCDEHCQDGDWISKIKQKFNTTFLK